MQLHVNGNVLHSDREKCAALSKQFKSISTVENGIEPPYERRVPANSFTTVSITDVDIQKSLHEMNSHSSGGDDRIPLLFIINLKCLMVEPLKITSQKSVDMGLVPDQWKDYLVVLVYIRNGVSNQPVSYRPICLTSVVCKLLEKIIRSKMLNHLSENTLLSEN